MSPLEVGLVAEGPLDEVVLRRLILLTAPHLIAGICYGRQGRGWIDANLGRYNNAARSWPFVSLADLEHDECPPALLRAWFPHGIHPNMRPRIAVRMVESWLLADREALAQYLAVAVHHIPQIPDDVPDPKQVMVMLAQRSRSRTKRGDMAPAPNSSGRVGPNYNGQLEEFTTRLWSPQRAQAHSPSLQRAIHCLRNFQPVLPGLNHAS